MGAAGFGAPGFLHEVFSGRGVGLGLVVMRKLLKGRGRKNLGVVLGDAMPSTIAFRETISGIPSPAPKSRLLQRRVSPRTYFSCKDYFEQVFISL